ncbi:MAG: hypothetical protein J2P30_23930 [Actinobacteria bacterium]|nr:hypothetical protein [Actinomycetota bacterium]
MRARHEARREARHEVSRRTALKTLALPAMTGLAGLGAAGCGTAAPTLNVAVVWTGWELRQFQRVMDEFTSRYGVGYRLLSMGNNTSAFLDNEVTAAAQPDVALVPQPGTVIDNRDRLKRVVWPPYDAESWNGLLSGPDGITQYGTWFKAANESMVWHTSGTSAAIPRSGWDWNSWTAWCKAQAKAGRPPLSIGAADGWVLADWFANVLLAFHPGTYRSLASAYRALALGHGSAADIWNLWHDSAIEESLHRLADLWGTPGLFPGGARRALATQFDQSVLDVFATGQAAMVAGADYYWPVITQYTRFSPDRVRWFGFPGAAPGQSPAVTSGDAAIWFKRPGGELYGAMLLEWLGTPEAARIWVRAGGFLSINELVKPSDYLMAYPTSMRVSELVTSVQDPVAEFDLADLLGGPLSGGDGEGAWKIFTDFFTDVAVRRLAPGAAANRAVAALANGESGA